VIKPIRDRFEDRLNLRACEIRSQLFFLNLVFYVQIHEKMCKNLWKTAPYWVSNKSCRGRTQSTNSNIYNISIYSITCKEED
jgi:hypothetical protein